MLYQLNIYQKQQHDQDNIVYMLLKKYQIRSNKDQLVDRHCFSWSMNQKSILYKCCSWIRRKVSHWLLHLGNEHIFHWYQHHNHHNSWCNVHSFNLKFYTKDQILNKDLYCWKMIPLNKINITFQYCPIMNKVSWYWLWEQIWYMYVLVIIHNLSNKFCIFQ